MSLCVRLCAEDVELGLACSTLSDPLSTEGDRYISEALTLAGRPVDMGALVSLHTGRLDF